MKRYNILATAVGAVVGYGIVESLRLSGYDLHIVGTDIFDDAVGQYFADDFVVATPAASDDYIPFLKRTIDEKQIDLVLFGIEQEIDKVETSLVSLGGYREKLVIPSKEIHDLCNDKWVTRKWLIANNLSEYAIDSIIDGNYDDIAAKFGKRFLIKPRVSRAGKGIVAVDNAVDFDYYKQKTGDNFMAQRIVGDEEREYTVGLFGLGDGSFTNTITMRRKLSQEGATAKAWVVEDEALLEATARISSILKPEGPTNYQFRKEADRVFLLEINPRISSSVSIRSKFGCNEPAMCVEYYLEERIPAPAKIKTGRAIRYIKDWIIES